VGKQGSLFFFFQPSVIVTKVAMLKVFPLSCSKASFFQQSVVQAAVLLSCNIIR